MERMESVSTINLEGRTNEKNDCSVRAVTTLTCLPYTKVHEAFKSAGRKNRHGTDTYITINVCKELGLNLNKIYECYSTKHAMTLNQMRNKLSKGWFLIKKGGHMFAVIDGIQYDNPTPSGGKSKVLAVWEVDFK